MTFTIHDPKLGPTTHKTAGLRAMREYVWNLAASGVTVIIEEDTRWG